MVRKKGVRGGEGLVCKSYFWASLSAFFVEREKRERDN